jgi:hypothetical protein
MKMNIKPKILKELLSFIVNEVINELDLSSTTEGSDISKISTPEERRNVERERNKENKELAIKKQKELKLAADKKRITDKMWKDRKRSIQADIRNLKRS